MTTKYVNGIILTLEKNDFRLQEFYQGSFRGVSFKVYRSTISTYRNGYSEWGGRKRVPGFQAVIETPGSNKILREHKDTLREAISDVIKTINKTQK